jgi:acyl dehydratase
MQPKAGATFTFARTFTAEDVAAFADVSADRQPRHTEADPPMVHGLLTATLPTKIGGDLEVLARSMNFEFPRPVHAGERIECTWTTEHVTERADRYEIEARAVCHNEDGKRVLVGEFEGVVLKE